jgi:sn-glycerol 3-phosphate transport system permease protein
MRNFKTQAFAWMLLAPTLLILGVFVFYPALDSFYLSLHEVDAFSTKKVFIGFDNYQMLLQSPEYWQSIQVSILFTLYTVIPSVILSLAAAVMLDANPYFRGVFRTLFLMPVAISSAMAAMLWIFFYNPSSGYLNYLLDLLHISGPNWLGSVHWALPAVAITTVWKDVGFNIIFFIAGLASVPADVIDAARIDGANTWQRFWHVTLPILSPTVLFVTVVSVLNAFQSFGQIHILTSGGPAGSTDTLVYNLYRDAFQNFQTGSASAQAVVLFLIMMAATGIQFYVAKKRIHYGG